MQAEAAGSELQVLPDEQQVPGQPVQCLHQQQGNTHTRARTPMLTQHQKNVRSSTTFDIVRAVCSRILTDSCRMWTSIDCELWSSGTWWVQSCCLFVFCTVSLAERMCEHLDVSCCFLLLIDCRMTASRPSFWLWPSSTSSPS